MQTAGVVARPSRLRPPRTTPTNYPHSLNPVSKTTARDFALLGALVIPLIALFPLPPLMATISLPMLFIGAISGAILGLWIDRLAGESGPSRGHAALLGLAWGAVVLVLPVGGAFFMVSGMASREDISALETLGTSLLMPLPGVGVCGALIAVVAGPYRARQRSGDSGLPVLAAGAGVIAMLTMIGVIVVLSGVF